MRKLSKFVMPLSVLLATTAALSDVPAAPPTTQPTSPAWLAKPLMTWPEIRLTNKVTTKEGSGFSGSSSFVKLPNGVIVLMTAGHLMDGVKLADFATGFKSWFACADAAPNRGMRMTKVAMDVDHPTDMDVLVLLPSSQHGPWPATVLPVRETPLTVGETVYLISIPEDGKTRQVVRKAEVTLVRDDDSVEYDVDATFKTTGNSGAPVIDSHGQLAAVNVAHRNDQTAPGKMQLVCINASAILRIIKLPPGMKPLILMTQPAVAAKAASSSVASASEAEAQKKLALVQYVTTQGVPPQMTNDLLKQIVDQYPDTQAAKQAKALLAKASK